MNPEPLRRDNPAEARKECKREGGCRARSRYQRPQSVPVKRPFKRPCLHPIPPSL